MKKTLGIFLILIMCFGLVACGGSESQEETYRFSSFSDFKTVRIALPVGSAIDTMIWKDLGTDVKLSYYQDFATEIEALKKGEVDAVCQEKLILRCFIGTGSDDYGIFPGVFSEDNHGFWFQKNDPLIDEFDPLIKKYLADGTVDEIYEKWATDTEAKVDWSQGGLAVNGKPEEGRKLISYYCYADAVPNSYVGDGGSFQGAEFEFLQLLCNELGYSLDIKMGTVDTIVFALTQGKADMVGGTITITPEREEQFDHTTPHYSGGLSFICMKDDIDPAAYETTEDPDLNSPEYTICSLNNMGEEFDNVFDKANRIYVNSDTEGVQAVINGQADAYATEPFIYESFVKAGTTGIHIHSMGPVIETGQVCAGVSLKAGISNAKEKIDEFIKLIKEDGTLDDMKQRWFVDRDYTKVALEEPENPTEKIVIGTSGLLEPSTFFQDGELAGFDIEIGRRFAAWLGVDVEFVDYGWDALTPAVATGKIDYILSNWWYDEEKEGSMLFSDTIYNYDIVLIVKDSLTTGEETVEESSFFEDLLQSFEKTFIRESRWKLILEGLGTTILIAFLSGLFGTIIGFYLSLLKVLDKKPLNIIIKCYCNFFVKIPALVVLMLVFFVVFKNVDISATVASIITFSLMFSTNVYGEIATGISAVDKGQWEASTALGFSKGKTFRVIIIPQVLRIALPNFKSDFVSMMKLTSIVGYIAVQDLTKASDIIRARTYEPFFPLISIAVIYFLISTLLFSVFERMELRVDFANMKPRLLKYVKTDIQISGGKTKHVQQEKGEIIRLEHIKKAYEQVTPLKDINASICAGEVISIIGPSGTGKSTLLRMINGLETQSEGKVFVFGQDTEDYDTDMNMLRQKMGMVFQSFNLFNNLNVVENVMIGPMVLKGIPAQEAYEKAMKALADVGMDSRAMNKPQVLSGGQKQRVAIARAVAMDPEIILFDEPTSALDPKMVDEVLNTIKDLSKSGITMLIVTHEMKFAREVSTRIIYLDQGEVYEDGTPEEIFEAPKRNRTRVFVNNQKMLVFAIRDKEYDFSVAIGEIYAFCRKNGVKGDRSMRLCNLFEEMSGTGIVPGEEASHSLHVLVEYNNRADQLSLRLIYEGPKWTEGDLELFESKAVFTYEAGRNTLIFENIE